MRKRIDRAFLGLLVLAMATVPGLLVLHSQYNTTAYYENRTLAARPDLNWESLWDGSYGTRMESWFSDHTPLRTTLLRAETALQLYVLGRPVVNDVVVTEDVLLPEMSYSEWSRAAYEANAGPIAENFGKLNRHVEQNGGTFYFVGLPEQRVYFEDKFPADMNSHAAEAANADEVFEAALTEAGVRFLNMERVYEELGHPDHFYSAVDHHYTYYGAYAAYRAITARLTQDGFAVPILEEEDLDWQELPNPYIGSRNRKLYQLWPHGEKAVIAVQKDPVAYSRTDNGQLSDKPLFVLPAEDSLPTSYNLYMGGDFGETILKTDRPELPNALIFGDSFTNAMETLLYTAFDETHILDLRHYTDRSLKDYITAYQPDVVLCVMNDTFYYTTTGNGAVWED